MDVIPGLAAVFQFASRIGAAGTGKTGSKNLQPVIHGDNGD
jgi:hypothetical protein